MAKLKYEGMISALGRDTVDEMDKMGVPELAAVIVQATSSMDQAEKELEANPKYQELKGSLNACTQGLKDVNKRQKARIAYSLRRLAELGKEPASEEKEV